MRRAIETVPSDGKVVMLEDDTSGTYELAQWSAEARAWVGENGELSKITPTYWHAMRRRLSSRCSSSRSTVCGIKNCDDLKGSRAIRQPRWFQSLYPQF